MRTFKVKFPRTLCDPGQLRDCGGGVVPVDIEADALCICPTDCDGWVRKRFEETLYTFPVPGQSRRVSFMRPVIEWCIAGIILTVPIQEPSTANLFIEMLLNAACADIRAMSEEVLRGCRELTPIGDSTKQKERITRAALPLPANNSGHNIQIASTGGG